VKRRLIEFGDEMARTKECEKDLWLVQLDWTLKKAGKSRVRVVSFSLLSLLLKLL